MYLVAELHDSLTITHYVPAASCPVFHFLDGFELLDRIEGLNRIELFNGMELLDGVVRLL